MMTVKSKTSDLFALTKDEVELLLRESSVRPNKGATLGVCIIISKSLS